MSVATIKLLNPEYVTNFYFAKGSISDVARALQDQYKVQGSMGIPDLEGESVAEEVFDLTNNPSRQDQREALYGRGRSLSVGDIVNVDGVDYLCAPAGWNIL